MAFHETTKKPPACIAQASTQGAEGKPYQPEALQSLALQNPKAKCQKRVGHQNNPHTQSHTQEGVAKIAQGRLSAFEGTAGPSFQTSQRPQSKTFLHPITPQSHTVLSASTGREQRCPSGGTHQMCIATRSLDSTCSHQPFQNHDIRRQHQTSMNCGAVRHQDSNSHGGYSCFGRELAPSKAQSKHGCCQRLFNRSRAWQITNCSGASRPALARIAWP